MPSFSEVVKDHQQLKETIAAIEETKKKIRKNELDMNPPEEFALRKNATAISVGSTNITEILDRVTKMGISSNSMLLGIFLQGILNRQFNPINALRLWSFIQQRLNSTLISISSQNASSSLTQFLESKQTEASFQDFDTKQIEIFVKVLLKDIKQTMNPRISIDEVQELMSRSIPLLATEIASKIPAPPAALSTNDIASAISIALPPLLAPLTSAAASSTSAPSAPATTAAPATAPSAPATAPATAPSTAPPAPGGTPSAPSPMAPSSATVTGVPVSPLSPASAAPSASLMPSIAALFSFMTPSKLKPDATSPPSGTPEGIGQLLMSPGNTGPEIKPQPTPPISQDQAIQWITEKRASAQNPLFVKIFDKIKDKPVIKNIPEVKDYKIEYITAIYLLGNALGAQDVYLKNLISQEGTQEAFTDDLARKIKVVLLNVASYQSRDNVRTYKPDFFVDIYQYKSSPAQTIPKPVFDATLETLFPSLSKKGQGLKSGRGFNGFKNMRQLISRTEDLISAAQMGNKSKEVFNELDGNLSALIDKKKITKKYRDNLMKKLFFQ